MRKQKDGNIHDMEPTKQKAVKKENSLSHDKLMKALYFISDLFSRPNIPFFLLDETAKAAKDNTDMKGDHITVGIRKVDDQYSNISIMNAFYGYKARDDKHIEYVYDDVPIIVKIIDSTDHMFTNLNTFMYQYEAFSLPNPFDKYWETRHKYA